MPRQFVRIVNRAGKYTNPERAEHYVDRGLAREHLVSMRGQVLEIYMLEAAELAILRTQVRLANEREREQQDDQVCAWYVGESGGSPLMYSYAGIGGGVRLWNGHLGQQVEV